MDWILNIFAAAFTALFGVWAFIKPTSAAKFSALQPKGRRGISEMRAMYGGLNIGLGTYALVSQSTESFQLLAAAYFMAAICRTISLAMDQAFSKTSIRVIIIEVVLGIFLLV